MAKKRTNVIPIIEDARHPNRYRMLLSMVDVIFADVAQPDQARSAYPALSIHRSRTDQIAAVVGLNAHHFLKNGGHVVVSVKANCIDSTAPAEVVFASEVKKMQEEMIKPSEQLTLGKYRSLAPPIRPPTPLRCCHSTRMTFAVSLLTREAVSRALRAGPLYRCRILQ